MNGFEQRLKYLVDGFCNDVRTIVTIPNYVNLEVIHGFSSNNQFCIISFYCVR